MSLHGRQVKIHNLWEYTSLRKSLLAKRIYVLVSVCKDSCNKADNEGEHLRPKQFYFQARCSVDVITVTTITCLHSASLQIRG